METRLKFKESICTSYVFHMLSVANIGYENDYRTKYKDYHHLEDLKILKNNETYLTVEGGSRCGQLYTLMVGIPATYDNIMDMDLYFHSIIELFSTGNLNREYSIFRNRYTGEAFEDLSQQRAFVNEVYEIFNTYSTEIINIAHVMLRNSKLFQEQIYEKTRPIVSEYTKAFKQTIGNFGDLMSKWEQTLLVTYKIPNFNVILIDSIDNGAQAIDINQLNDVFGMYDNHEVLVRFISHELGTYLMMENLSDEVKSDLLDYWNAIESLSSYLNTMYITGLADDVGANEYIEWYKSNCEMGSDFILEQLIKRAREEIEKNRKRKNSEF